MIENPPTEKITKNISKPLKSWKIKIPLHKTKYNHPLESTQTFTCHCSAHPVPTGTDAAVALHLGLCSILIGFVFQGTL